MGGGCVYRNRGQLPIIDAANTVYRVLIHCGRKSSEARANIWAGHGGKPTEFPQFTLTSKNILCGKLPLSGRPLGRGGLHGGPTWTRIRPGSDAWSNSSPGTAPSPHARATTPVTSAPQSARPRRFAFSLKRPVCVFSKTPVISISATWFPKSAVPVQGRPVPHIQKYRQCVR